MKTQFVLIFFLFVYIWAFILAVQKFYIYHLVVHKRHIQSFNHIVKLTRKLTEENTKMNSLWIITSYITNTRTFTLQKGSKSPVVGALLISHEWLGSLSENRPRETISKILDEISNADFKHKYEPQKSFSPTSAVFFIPQLTNLFINRCLAKSRETDTIRNSSNDFFYFLLTTTLNR